MVAADQPGVPAPGGSSLLRGTTATFPGTPRTPGPTPQRVGNYIILERLGTGGFGDVYLGRHRFLGVHAAVKVLHGPLPPDRRRAFVREARRLYSLRGHPSIVELREFGFFRP